MKTFALVLHDNDFGIALEKTVEQFRDILAWNDYNMTEERMNFVAKRLLLANFFAYQRRDEDGYSISDEEVRHCKEYLDKHCYVLTDDKATERIRLYGGDWGSYFLDIQSGVIEPF